MSITTIVSLLCNHKDCKTAPITAGARKATKVAARKAGWKIKGLKVMYCPAHRAENGYPTAAQRKADRLAKKAKAAEAKKSTKAPVSKKAVKAVKPVAPKPVTKKAVKPAGKTAVTGMGQAVPGMVAKSAKRGSVK
jgi:hypothetical protein